MRSAIRTALLAVALAACGAAGSGVASAPGLRHWKAYVAAQTPVDLAGPLPDGSFVLAAKGRLWLLGSAGAIRPHPGNYVGPGGEPYIALSPGGCYGRGTVYALRLAKPIGVTAITGRGRVSRFATIAGAGLLNGIAFDTTGRFGGRLLVTQGHGATSTIYAIGCRGRVATITAAGPRVEGGISVAPAGFGRFGGDLIAPDEIGGGIYAIGPRGAGRLLVASGLPHGQDIGVESEAFIPASGARYALVADRLTPGNRHPGDNRILRLNLVGLAPGSLLVASEGAALTDIVTCSRSGCRARRLADGPPLAHVEGHVVLR